MGAIRVHECMSLDSVIDTPTLGATPATRGTDQGDVVMLVVKCTKRQAGEEPHEPVLALKEPATERFEYKLAALNHDEGVTPIGGIEAIRGPRRHDHHAQIDPRRQPPPEE